METTNDRQAGRRRYWAQRHGTRSEKLDLPSAVCLYRSAIAGLIENGYLQEWFGYYCVDATARPAGQSGSWPAGRRQRTTAPSSFAVRDERARQRLPAVHGQALSLCGPSYRSVNLADTGWIDRSCPDCPW